MKSDASNAETAESDALGDDDIEPDSGAEVNGEPDPNALEGEGAGLGAGALQPATPTNAGTQSLKLAGLKAPDGKYVLSFNDWNSGLIHSKTENKVDAQPKDPFKSIVPPSEPTDTLRLTVEEGTDGTLGNKYLRGATGGGGNSGGRDYDFKFAPQDKRALIAYKVKIDGENNMAMIHIGHAATGAGAVLSFSLMKSSNQLAHRPGTASMVSAGDIGNSGVNANLAGTASGGWNDILIDFQMGGKEDGVDPAYGDFNGSQYAVYVNGVQVESTVVGISCILQDKNVANISKKV